MTWLKKYFYLLPVLLYLPALGNFFSGDDWFHLRITQIESIGQFFNFFSFSQSDQSASFYRPLSTQVFFSVFQSVFGLHSLPYYLFGLLLFGYTIHLVQKFSSLYLKPNVSNLAALLYGLSVSNFTRVYFISAFQELFLVVFSLLSLINFRTKPKLSQLFFILALLSKETAIVLPALVLLLNYKYIVSSKFLPLRSEILISAIYLYFRFFHFGLVEGDSYVWDFSITKAANTLMWYLLWSLGAPELLIDYVASGLKIVPKFFTDYQTWWRLILYPLLATLALAFTLYLKNLKKLSLNFYLFCLFFLISLLPVLFLPSHKFALELGLPLVGFSVALALLLSKKINTLSIVFLLFFVFYNLSMNYLTHTRHYSVSRGQIAKKVHTYFLENYPKEPEDYYFKFINDAEDNGDIWGQSKQISQSLSSSDFFKVFYKNKSSTVYYEDIPVEIPTIGIQLINISTKMFLNQ